MKIYDFKLAPNPRRVRIFLAEKGLTVPREPVDIFARRNREPAFLAKNPFGTIPVLELDDGTCISESVAICRYFEEEHPEPPLFGTGARDKAEVEMWSRRVELIFSQALRMIWIHGSPLTAKLVPQIPENVEPNRRSAAQFLEVLDRALSDRPFIAGERFSIADIGALCSIDFGKRALELTLDPALASLARWYAAVAARPSASA
jgi:glutathione S-transferase